MKTLAILTLIALPISQLAFADRIPYNNSKYLELAGGDVAAAMELDRFCGTTGRTYADCKATLGGEGNLRAEAARKCVRQAKFLSLSIEAKRDPTRETEFAGSWHFDNKKTGGEADSGRSHSHHWTDADRQRAYEARYRQLVSQTQAAKAGGSNTSTKDNSSSLKGSASVGDPLGVVKVGLEGGGGQGSKSSSTTESTKLTKDELTAIDREAEKARQDPSLVDGMKPTGVCLGAEKSCTEPSGKVITNPNYDPKEVEREKKKEDKKTSDNSPKAESGNSPNIPDEPISSRDGGTWAGGPNTSTPNTAIATPVMDKDSLPATLMDLCMITETRKLEVHAGSVTVDSNAVPGEEQARKAKEALDNGYCIESFYGREECAKMRFKQDSVVAIDVELERADHYNSAMADYQKTGICDPNVLGSDFCDIAAKKWDSTPMPMEPVFEGTNRPSLITPELDRHTFEGGSDFPRFTTPKRSGTPIRGNSGSTRTFP